MKKILIILFLVQFSFVLAQEDRRIQDIRNQLEQLAVTNPGLQENVKSDISLTRITLSNFLLGLSEVHQLNLTVAPELNEISVSNNFTNVNVADVLSYMCKEYELTIEFTGNILSIKKYIKPDEPIVKRGSHVVYMPSTNEITIDAKEDNLYDLFVRIMDETGKNLVFTPGMEAESVTAYIQNSNFDSAMDKLALANNLYVERSKDNFYVFQKITDELVLANDQIAQKSVQRPIRRRTANFFFEVKDQGKQLLDVDFQNVLIADIINDIGLELDIDIFTATPLETAGIATLKARDIRFDDLLVALFEKQRGMAGLGASGSDPRNGDNGTSGSSSIFTFKKEGNIYYFGTEDQLSVRTVEIIHLQHRSVQLLGDPTSGGGGNSGLYGNQNFLASAGGPNQFDNVVNRSNTNTNRRNVNTGSSENFSNYGSQAEALVGILPDEVKKDLDIKIDFELNSFYVNGPSANVERFKKFIKEIDKPVPVVLIEVMIIEVSKNATIEAGVNWGIGDSPTQTQGDLFPETNLTLGAESINRLIGSFNDFTGFNLGRVGPNFFGAIKALETNGDLKVRSTPRLATLNSHRAIFSNSQTSFYAVTQRNIYGTDNPQTTEITNYYPIDAELSLTIKPSVTGDGQVILDIGVIQSSFGGRIAEDAPPDINSRSFGSIIRMRDQDLAILGGIEEQFKNNSGSGVPFLAKVPVLKWLFSKRVREGRKSKLTVLIKPTIIN